MAMSGKRTVQRFREKLSRRFNINLGDVPELELLFESLIEEIQQEMEASKVNSPSQGYTVTIPDPNNLGQDITYDIDGTSTDGDINKGNFR